jgi:hypothetical protein
LVVYHPVRLSHASSACSGSSAVKWLKRKVPERFSSVSPIRLLLRAHDEVGSQPLECFRGPDPGDLLRRCGL